MKYIVTKSQLLEATKFSKKNVVSDKYCPMVEKLIIDHYGDKICDILVIPSPDNEQSHYVSHYVLISYNGYSVVGKNGIKDKIEKLIDSFFPIEPLVVIIDNDSGCDDNDSNL